MVLAQFTELAQTIPPEEALDWLTRGGAMGIMALAVVAFLREWVVPGSVHQRCEKDRDEWKDLAWRSLSTTDKAVTLADRDKP